MLGAGGGARAVVYGLIREGFQRVIVFNRHLHRAEGLVKHFGRSAAHMELRAMPWHESIIESELAKTKVLVNATSIGLTADVSPVPAEVLHGELLVLDLIYAQTRLLRDAQAAGATVADGELMLLHQGAAAFTLWTGQPAPLELMQAKLAEARAGGLRSAEGEPTGEPAAAARRVTAFRFLTAGESHGPALGVTIEGVPAGPRADRGRHRRRPRPTPDAATAAGARQTIEQDRAEILGGVRHGRDARLADPAARPQPRLGELDAGHAGRSRSTTRRRELLASSPRAATSGRRPVTRVRPGHADLAGALKYGFNDVRNVLERASARETAARVAAGRRRARVPARARDRGLVVHGRGRRRGGRPGQLHPLARRGRRLARCAARTPTPRRR